MDKSNEYLKGRFLSSIYVDEEYHNNHSQYLHSHSDFLEILYIIEGNGLYFVDKREYIVHAGNIIICSAGITHGEGPLRKNNMISYCCRMDNIKIDGLPENVLISDETNPVLYFPSGEAGHIMQAMHSVYSSGDSSPVCELLSEALLNLVYKRLAERRQEMENRIGKENRGEFISYILDYLDKYYFEALTIEGLAERFHMSKSAFSHFFKEEVGVSPIKYVLYRRIGEAQSMLMNTDLPFGEIGSALGYYDSSHFSSVFKKHTGLTPSQYRKNFPKNIRK